MRKRYDTSLIRNEGTVMDDEWAIGKWLVTSEPRVIYIKPEDVPVCLVEKDSGWKPPENCHTKYGLIEDPRDAKNYYDYLKKERENNNG